MCFFKGQALQAVLLVLTHPLSPLSAFTMPTFVPSALPLVLVYVEAYIVHAIARV